MTKLERRCRALLLVYPAAYRRERADEMVGTLLEATPEGRRWPPGRHVRTLLAGGVRARAALNRRLSLRANVRTAVFVGLAAFLGFDAIATLSNNLDGLGWLSGWTQLPSSAGWAATLGPPLILIAVAVAWLSRNRIAVLAAALPAAAASVIPLTASCSIRLAGTCYGYAQFGQPVRELGWYETAIQLGCLAGLVALSSAIERPPWGWLAPVGLVLLASAIPESGELGRVADLLWLAVGAVSLAWIVVDARPAVAVCVFLTVDWVQAASSYRLLVSISAFTIVPLLVLGALAALAVWRLRVQSGRAPGQRA